MPTFQKYTRPIGSWLSKDWSQWLVAAIIFFLFSWLYMGSAINHCSTTTTALGSDTTGGFGWTQWAAGNDLTWGHTDKSNYPVGENLTKPQFVTSSVFIFLYKVFASLTTPICGINLVLLLGYMSGALLMFGLVKWLLKRFDIALFAGYAAAFVPFHVFKSESHVNYTYGGVFIALVWAYLWFLRRPSYKRAALLAAVSSIGFYFDGYFILISSIMIAALFASSFIYDAARSIFGETKNRRRIVTNAVFRLKRLLLAVALLGLLLLPILATYKTSGQAIKQSLSTVRSDIRVETLIYGVRPIEFILPGYNNPLLPAKYAAYRATKLHNSNYSEGTLYMGYTIIVLALVGVAGVFFKNTRRTKFADISYAHLVFTMALAFTACFMFSLPDTAHIFGHDIKTPTELVARVTSNWRTISRLFLAMDPLVIILAAMGLYVATKRFSKPIQVVIVAACGLILFLEYLPAPLHPTGDLYKNAPPVYKQLQKDNGAKLVAEYPLADFLYSPEIFTFQPVHDKTLLNANDGSISRGPFDSSIAGLNDVQTLGALKQMRVDVLITHGFMSQNPGLSARYNIKTSGPIVPGSMFAYTINDSVVRRPDILSIQKGYESLSVDQQQISHRAVTQQGVMRVLTLAKAAPASRYNVSFNANSLCPTKARVSVTQGGQTLWSGSVGKRPVPVSLTVTNKDFYVNTADCSIDVTEMSAEVL